MKTRVLSAPAVARRRIGGLPLRLLVRDISSVLMISGLLLVVDAGLTLIWQEPVTAVIALIQRSQIDKHYLSFQTAPLTQTERHVLVKLPSLQQRIAYLARREQHQVGTGDAVGHIRIPKIGASYTVVQGTDEASLEKGPRLGVLGAVIEVDGRPVSAFGCDGVLVATPTGSTAWAFSAGGPIVWPDLEAILVVPNNAHALFARPMVTSPEAAIAIEVEASGHDALVFCDGRREMIVPAGGRLEVTRCGTPLKWVRLDSAPFTDRLVRKFRLPVTGWRGQ